MFRELLATVEIVMEVAASTLGYGSDADDGMGWRGIQQAEREAEVSEGVRASNAEHSRAADYDD